MPTIGDLIAKWANGRNALLRGEVEELRLKLNRIEAAASRLDTLSAPTGGLDPNIFGNSGQFTVLPVPVASLRFAAQNIATGTTYGAPTVDTTGAATWNYGVTVDLANAKLQIPGMPGHSILLFVLWWRFDPNATNHRGLKWTDNSGNSVEDVRAGFATYNNYLHITHVRRMASTDTWYQLQVFQNSGGNLSGDGLFTVFRLH
jgi:hypothetical protein